MADPSLASNNPFRRKSTVPIASSTASSAASGLTLDTTSTATPSHAFLAKSSTFPQSPSDASAHPFATHAGALGAPGPAGNSTTAADDTYAYDYEDQDAERGRSQATIDAFREHLQALPKSTEAPPSTTFLKPKPIKKVRVQSPPPSSPSSPSSVDSVDADFEERFPSNLSGATDAPAGAPPTTGFGDYGTRGGLLDDRPVRNYDDYSSESDDSESDDDSAGRSENAGASTATSSFPSFPAQAQQQPPPNPFQKTLGDLEPGQTRTDEAQSDPAAAAAASPGKTTLDVDAFSRLLLTGQGPAAAPVPPPAAPARADAAPAAQETPRTSHEISENDDDRSGLIHGAPATNDHTPRQTLRKKPPPPSSRHGKLIKAQSKEKTPAKEGAGQDPTLSSSSSSDVNKPLPLPPTRRSANVSEDDEDAMDSIFDREAAGKLPEVDLDPEAPEGAVPPPRPPTPPNASHSAEFSPSHPISDQGAEALVSSSAAPVPPVAAATTTTPSSHPKKPTPAPPPRRQAAHIRTESRSNPAHERPPLPAPPAHALLSGDGSALEQQRDRSPLGSPRSSLDSTRSRSSSFVKAAANANANPGVNVPAPPPPRRANHAPRPSTSSFTAPLQASASTPALSPPALSDNDRLHGVANLQAGSSIPSLASLTVGGSGTGTSTPVPNRLLAKPPPPPARNTSVRHKDGRPAALASTDSSGSLGSGAGSGSGRPSSVASFDAVARRVGPHHPPPPPPTRQRGSSRGSMDAPAGHANATNHPTLLGAPPSISSTPRKVSSESVRRTAGNNGQGLSPAEEGDENRVDSGADESGVANNILADLDALRREVDALRGQF